MYISGGIERNGGIQIWYVEEIHTDCMTATNILSQAINCPIAIRVISNNLL